MSIKTVAKKVLVVMVAVALACVMAFAMMGCSSGTKACDIPGCGNEYVHVLKFDDSAKDGHLCNEHYALYVAEEDGGTGIVEFVGGA